MRKIKMIVNIVLLITLIYCATLFIKLMADNEQGQLIREEKLQGNQIGIAIDSKKNIYIGSTDKGEIFVYDIKGKYKYSICFSTALGDYTYGIANDKPYILITRHDYISVYDENQVLKTSLKVPPKGFQEASYKFKQGNSIYSYLYGKQGIKVVIDDSKEVKLGDLKIVPSKSFYFGNILLLWGIFFAINFAKKAGLDKLKKYLEY